MISAALVLLCGCTAAPPPATQPAVVDSAAAEATAIIQRAQATALVLQAQAQATALIQGADNSPSTPVPTVSSPVPPATPLPDIAAAAFSAAPPPPTGKATDDISQVQLLGVSLGTESGLIAIQFRAPPAVTRDWQQMNVYVVDEATGVIYNEVPVAPVVGPLISRPKKPEQIGYVMLVNTEGSLHQGAHVTVVLGKFKQEHVVVT